MVAHSSETLTLERVSEKKSLSRFPLLFSSEITYARFSSSSFHSVFLERADAPLKVRFPTLRVKEKEKWDGK